MNRVGLQGRRIIGYALAAAGVLALVRPVSEYTVGLLAQASAIPTRAARVGNAPLVEGEALGRLELPRLGLDLVVFEGASDATLRKGPGHIPGTAWPNAPGTPGHCVITGHRDSFFRRLESARRNDLVRLHGSFGTSIYRLASRRVVRPHDVSVVAPTPEGRLTLITCYPFRWSGSAPYRLVWTAFPVDPRERDAVALR
jgi:sortase A